MVTRGEKWVLDGNYSKVRDLAWGRADTLVWLDYPFLIVLGRLIKRSIPRVFTHQELWNGNYESFRGMFLSRDSLFIWLIPSYSRHKKSYPKLLSEPAYAHLSFIRLCSPKNANQWLNEII